MAQEIISVKKNGDTYTVVTGERNARGERTKTSTDIHASALEGKSEREARNIMGRAAQNVARAGYSERV